MSTKTFAGTLKVEIIKPENDSWDNVGARLRVLRSTIAPALTNTMRQLYPDAMDMVAFIRSGDKDLAKKAKTTFENRIESTLRKSWNNEIQNRKTFLRKQELSDNNIATTPEIAFSPITEYWTAETRQNILSRFVGEHLKALLRNEASIPSWTTGCTFYARSRACNLEGSADHAIITLPLFGSGKKGTRLVVAPCGKQAISMWNQLVNKEVKFGRIGVTYCERKKKWYALISWTKELDAQYEGKETAAIHIGINNFIQAISTNGKLFNVSGEDILATRQKFAVRRASIQRCINTMGSGSKGRGVKRRMLPLTKLNDKESRYVTTKCRQISAALIKWCKNHDIGMIYLPDLSGIRDEFESKTEGNASSEVKRLIHNWPFYELTQAIIREATEHGVNYKLNKIEYNSITCPSCKYNNKENIFYKSIREEVLIHNGKRFVRNGKVRRFKCHECGLSANADVVACSNFLIKMGHRNMIHKINESVNENITIKLSI